jgi:hypothetical protein
LAAPKRVLCATLIRGGIVVQYFPGNGHVGNGAFGSASPNVRVNALRSFQFRTLTMGYPISWTYKSLTRISPLDIDRHDWRFFSQARRWAPPFPDAPSPATIAIKTAGTNLTVRFKWLRDPRYDIVGIMRSSTFDLSMGGMVGLWKFRAQQASGGSRTRQSSTITTAWRESGGRYFPERRVIVNSGQEMGKDGTWKSAGSLRTVIKFAKFKSARISSKVFTVANLRILTGSLVFDNVHRSHYPFRPVDARRLLGREDSASGPQTLGGD